MEALLDLKQLGSRLQRVDRMIMDLLKVRMGLAGQVGRYKRRTNEKIFRADIEDQRIADIKAYAATIGLNPHFAALMLYASIDEACKQQMIQLQEEQQKDPETEDEWYASLKRNLILLTERCCESYDQGYDAHAFATKAYLRFEQAYMEREIEGLAEKEVAVDLGCATGRLTHVLIRHFERVIGYDLSQHMVTTAWKNAAEFGFTPSRVSYEQADVEEGIPAEDASASFVVMNLGTASDVRNIEMVLAETMRVLRPGGKFFFSFYNRDALVYQWDFLPWPIGLAAYVNLHRHCLEVKVGEETFALYARPYTVSEVDSMLRGAGARDVEMHTFPTISSILPDGLFEEQHQVQRIFEALEAELSTENLGAYIMATGTKA